MYSTVREIHNAIDIGSQHINSNRKREFQAPELDILFNRNLLRFIDTKVSSKSNVKQEGFDDSTKRISDLSELKSSTGFIKLNKVSNTLSCVTLPYNFKEFSSATTSLFYDCNNTKFDTDTDTISKAILDFPNDITGNNGVFYKDFTLTATDNNGNSIVLFNINDYYKLETLLSTDAKFMIVNIIMNAINPLFSLYWEKYGNEFYSNKFVLIDFTNTYNNITLSYNTTSVTAQFNTILNDTYNIDTNFVSPIELVPSDKFDNLINNFYYNKNRYRKPLAKIENGILYVSSTDFYLKDINLSYISTPIFINSFTDTMTNVRTNIQEVIDMTIKDIELIISPNITASIQRNTNIT